MKQAFFFSSPLTGNGVVIHLPGLFEEGDKNEKKGIMKKYAVVGNSPGCMLYSLGCDISSLSRSERLGEETYRLRQSSPWCVF